jgi:hypothetical protein
MARGAVSARLNASRANGNAERLLAIGTALLLTATLAASSTRSPKCVQSRAMTTSPAADRTHFASKCQKSFAGNHLQSGYESAFFHVDRPNLLAYNRLCGWADAWGTPVAGRCDSLRPLGGLLRDPANAPCCRRWQGRGARGQSLCSGEEHRMRAQQMQRQLKCKGDLFPRGEQGGGCAQDDRP